MGVPGQEVVSRGQALRLGLLSGALAGLALALGAWTSDAVSLGLSHVRLVYPSLIGGCLALVLLGGLGGWLAARLGRALPSMLIWLVMGWLMMLVIGHQPYEGRTLTMWLSDPNSWGLPVYRFDPTAGTGMALAGFFTLLLFGSLGLLQPYRLETIAGETEQRGRPNTRGWFMLLLPLPLVVGVGLINDAMVNRPLRVAPRQVHEAITTGRTYEGDLFELSLDKGVNYNAISAVRAQMSERFFLTIGETDLGVADTVYVVADFDNGAWITCRVVADQLSFCYDASQPYLRGLSALIATGQAPEDCPYCRFAVGEELRAWLQAQSGLLGSAPSVSRLAQWGSYVKVRAASADGGHAIECLFHGSSPVSLESCRVAEQK
jgi:hypothetical protein